MRAEGIFSAMQSDSDPDQEMLDRATLITADIIECAVDWRRTLLNSAAGLSRRAREARLDEAEELRRQLRELIRLLRV